MTIPMRLTHCTLTGVDERTDLIWLADLSEKYPVAEWGFLYSPKRQGATGRYPSFARIKHALETLPKSVRVAIHFCGEGVYDLLVWEARAADLMGTLAARGDGSRVQLNFNMQRNPISTDALRLLMTRYPQATFITQQNHANANLWHLFSNLPNYGVLFDESGGAGVCAERPPRPLPLPKIGYAGGLGPHNLHTYLDDLAHLLCERSAWVDMESSLRTVDEHGGDWFDLSACEAALDHAQRRVPRGLLFELADGWWVPEFHYLRQTLLPTSGTWQTVRCFNRIELSACHLNDESGWVDSNYNPISGVTQWRKPKQWFHDELDLGGKVEAFSMARSKMSASSPLRSTGEHFGARLA